MKEMTYYAKNKNNPEYIKKIKEQHRKYIVGLKDKANKGNFKAIRKLAAMRNYNTDYRYYYRTVVTGKYKGRIERIKSHLGVMGDTYLRMLEKSQHWADLAKKWQDKMVVEQRKIDMVEKRVAETKARFEKGK